MRFAVLPLTLGLTIGILSLPAQAQVDTTVLPGLTSWEEGPVESLRDTGMVVWSNDGTMAVEGSGFIPDYAAQLYFGLARPAVPVLLNATLRPQQTIFPEAVAFHSASFSPDDAWFVAVFYWGSQVPFDINDPSLQFSVQLATWRTDTWVMVNTQEIWNVSAFRNDTPPSVPMNLRWSRAGDQLFMWDELWGSANFTGRVELRAFPGMGLVAGRYMPISVLDAEWSPDDSLLAVAMGGRESDNGSIAILNSTTLAPLRNVTRPNSLYNAVSWAPNGNSIAVKSAHFAYKTGCSSFWNADLFTLEVVATIDLSRQLLIRQEDGTSQPCGLPDHVFQGTNGSGKAMWHPTDEFMLMAWGDNVSVFDTRYWEEVFRAEVAPPNGSLLLYSDLHWAGRSRAFSFATLGLVSGGPQGWPATFEVERALYRNFSRVPSASVGLGPNGNGTALYPERQAGPLTLNISLDSLPRLYVGLELEFVGGVDSIRLFFDRGNQTLVQTAGIGLIEVVGGPTATAAWAGFASFTVALHPQWNISHHGPWAASVRVLLANGSVTAGTMAGGLRTHLQVEVAGPLLLVDLSRGAVGAAGYENRTPQMRVSWGPIRFAASDIPLLPSEFELELAGDLGGRVRLTGAEALTGNLTRVWSFDAPIAMLEALLAALPAHALDVTNLSRLLLIDASPPTLESEAPLPNAWTAGFSLQLSFTATDLEAGVSLAEASSALFLLSSALPESMGPATPVIGTDGSPFAKFNATHPLPQGARLTLRLQLEARDAVGNLASINITVEVDREPPSLGSDLWPPWINTASHVFRWSCLDSGIGLGGAVQEAAYRSAPGAAEVLQPGVPDGTQPGHGPAFRADFALTEGDLGNIVFRCVDGLGNTNEPPPLSVRVDLTAPRITSAEPNGTETLGGVHHVMSVVLFEAGSGIQASAISMEVSVDGGASFAPIRSVALSATGPGSFTLTFEADLLEGDANFLRLTGRDVAGNAFSAAPWRLRVNGPPTLTILSPADNETLSIGVVDLTADAQDPDGDDLTIRWVSAGDGRLLGAGLSLRLALGPGVHALVAEADDGHGHLVRARVNFTILEATTQPTDLGWAAWVLVPLAAAAVAAFVVVRRRAAR